MSVTTHRENQYLLTASCPSVLGIVAAMTGFLAQRKCYIVEMAEFDNVRTGRFFTRIVYRIDPETTPPLDQIAREFEDKVATPFQMEWSIHDTLRRPRVLIMVSKFDHCLNDLLYRYRTGELHMEIPVVVSNHADLEKLVQWHNIPFVHLPVTPENKADQEARLLEIVDETQSELVVLARYMQVISKDLCEKMSGRMINIHHSFLPGFKGAKPYHQAYERGVKLIGATAHYVTTDLDEGPIIEQVVERVDHTFRPENLVAAGRDSENVALSRAVRFHIERRVFLDGSRTVVFR